jgi:hypothetical protein
MKQYILNKNMLVVMLLAVTHSFSIIMAQEVMPAAGGNASGDGGSVSYSIGQLTYQLHSGTSGSVAEGVQIPYEITVVTAIDEFPVIKLVVTAYPNPTTDYLILQVNDYAGSDLSYFLYDMQGKLLQQEIISDSHTSIYMGDLVPAVYFVKVVEPDREMKTFKIVKN